MTETQIRETARRLTEQEIEQLFRKAYYSFDAKLRDFTEQLKERYLGGAVTRS